MTNLEKSKYNAVIETVSFPSLTFYSVTYNYRENGVTKTDAKDFYTYEEAKEFFNSIN